MWGLRFRVQGLGLRVKGLGFGGFGGMAGPSLHPQLHTLHLKQRSPWSAFSDLWLARNEVIDPYITH